MMESCNDQDTLGCPVSAIHVQRSVLCVWQLSLKAGEGGQHLPAA